MAATGPLVRGPSESCARDPGCDPASTCPPEAASLPSAGPVSGCQASSFLPGTHLSPGCPAPCYLAAGCDGGCLVECGPWCEDGAFNIHEKETMRFLNDRLANYLEKVHYLEAANAELESKIQGQCDPDALIVGPDYQGYFNTIEDLQQKILCTKAENSRLAVQLDNCKLATSDLRSRYDSELSLRQLVENDISGLRGILGQLSLCRSDLEAQVESLKDDLLCLKKSHREEVSVLRGQLGDRLTVEMDTAPTMDLSGALEEMRHQYETVLADNRREAAEWFSAQAEELSQQQLSSAEQLQGCQVEVLELKRTANTLEIELQAQQNLTDSLECTVAETEAQYSTQLAQMQGLIDNVETQLAEIRCDLERQNQEYQVLLDTKARLEQEIATYRHLLDGEDCRLASSPCSAVSMSGNPCEPGSAYILCTVENCCA